MRRTRTLLGLGSRSGSPREGAFSSDPETRDNRTTEQLKSELRAQQELNQQLDSELRVSQQQLEDKVRIMQNKLGFTSREEFLRYFDDACKKRVEQEDETASSQEHVSSPRRPK